MGNKYLDTSLFDKAVKFAVDAHANTERRGKGFPYVIHLMEAAEIVSGITTDPELLAAAMLHDVVEDTDYTEEDIRKEFGDRVAGLVSGESDPECDEIASADSWVMRKQFVIDRLANQPIENKIVALGDKLSNMRAIAHDFNMMGDELWDRFHAPDPTLHKWHYEGLVKALSDLVDTDAYKEFAALVEDVFSRAFKSNVSDHVVEAKELNIDDWDEFGEGYTSVSYYSKTDPNLMLKLYRPFIDVDFAMQELEHVKHVTALGIKTPKAGELYKYKDMYACTFERVKEKRSFARAMSQEPEKTEFYTRRFAQISKELHSTPCDLNYFKSVKDAYITVIGKVDKLTIDEKIKLVKFVRSVEDCDTCVHGDLHSGNVLLTPDGKEYIIDLGDFCYGSPMFDLGILQYTSCFIPEHALLEIYHCGKEQMHDHWIYFLKEYFGTEDDAEIAEIEKKILPFAALRAVAVAQMDHWHQDAYDFVAKVFDF